ncbi:MAG: hypothetical protein AB7P99_22045 [Vicinamibacterales bacterium]
MTEEPTTVAGALRWVVADPWNALARRWNYKSAILSATLRAGVFFAANLPSGAEAATLAMAVEFVFRFSTAGFYGALTQAFRRVEPALHGTLAAMILLPGVAHSLEAVVHLAAGTPRLRDSMAASLMLTALSTSFNLFAMRRGAFVVGHGSQSLLRDVFALPALGVAFIAAVARSCLGQPTR